MAESQIHVLVVDDERDICNYLGMVLEAEGYQVEKCGNGDDAIVHVKQARYGPGFVDNSDA